jgi:simple sugar transport system permease protein
MNVIIGLINGMISSATPLLLSALGGSLTFYAGIFNIAMEGMMLSGAFFAVLGSYFLHSWVAGIICGILGALLMALIFILFSIVLKVDEFVTGVGLNMFSLGLTTYLLRQIFSVKGAFTNPGIVSVPRIHLPFLESIPFLGKIISGQNLIVWLALIATIVCNFVVFRTQFGLRLRAAGYNRTCLDTSGVSSNRIQAISLIICAVLCGLAGSFLSLGYVTLFSENMSAGRGWISLAAVILVSGKPLGIALVSLIFGLADGLGLYLQASLPSQFTAMLPYVATLIALFFYSMKSINTKVEI